LLKIQCVFALLAALTVSSIGQSATIDFSGSGTSGTIPPGSMAWVVTPDDATTMGLDCISPTVNRCDISVWGVPGLGALSLTWPSGNGDALSFTVTFTGLPGGVTIDQTADPAPNSFDDFTRFQDITNLTLTAVWTPSYTGGNSVTFTDPSAGGMPAGDVFFVNVAFTGGTVDAATFTGDWTTDAPVAGVPEPGSLSLAGLVLVGAAMFARGWPQIIAKSVGRILN
jgi:hypothetical protein